MLFLPARRPSQCHVELAQQWHQHAGDGEAEGTADDQEGDERIGRFFAAGLGDEDAGDGVEDCRGAKKTGERECGGWPFTVEDPPEAEDACGQEEDEAVPLRFEARVDQNQLDAESRAGGQEKDRTQGIDDRHLAVDVAQGDVHAEHCAEGDENGDAHVDAERGFQILGGGQFGMTGRWFAEEEREAVDDRQRQRRQDVLFRVVENSPNLAEDEFLRCQVGHQEQVE